MRRIIALALILVGCNRAEEPSARPAREARGEPPAELSGDGPPAEPPAVDSQDPADPPEADTPEPTQAELEAEAARLEATVNAALHAAETAETGSTRCESAHDGIAAMIREVSAQYPDDTRPVPPRLAFIQLCEQLAPEVQSCLIPTYATAHVAECTAVTEGLSEGTRARLDALLRSE